MLRVIYRDQFVRGPFHLGPFSYPVAVTAVIWILFISIAFILPQVNVGISLKFYDHGLIKVPSLSLSTRKRLTTPSSLWE